jgi:ABC-2 type transport system permease protein
VKLLASELRLRRTSLVVWVASVFALVAMITAFYPQIRSDPSLNSIYATMSPAVQALLGGSDLTSPAGYLNTQVFAFFLPAVLLVFGLGRGSASIASEEEETSKRRQRSRSASRP